MEALLIILILHLLISLGMQIKIIRNQSLNQF
jgi:hypothetical protein